MNTKRDYFTLIELLIIVAIIAILAALLLPALKQAKVKAKSVACMSQFKQVATAFASYTVDSGEYFPPMAYLPSGSSNYSTLDYITWIDMISELKMLRGSTIPTKYFDGKKRNYLLLCPATWLRESSYGNYDGITTGYNQPHETGNTLGRFRKLSEITRPSWHLTFADSWKDKGKNELNRRLGHYRLSCSEGIAFRHSRRATACYLDGHVALENQQWLRLNNNNYYPLNRSGLNGYPRIHSSYQLISDFSPF